MFKSVLGDTRKIIIRCYDRVLISSDVPINLFESILHRRVPECGYSILMIDTGGRGEVVNKKNLKNEIY